MKLSKLLFIVATLPVLSFAGNNISINADGFPRGPVNPEPCMCPEPFIPMQPSPKVKIIKSLKPKNIKKFSKVVIKKNS